MSSRLRHFITIGLITISLTGCGESRSEKDKAKTRAQVLVAKNHYLQNDIQRMGTPSANWSDAEISAYESKLDQLDSLDKELAALNGSHGITILGSNRAIIAVGRTFVATARAQKGGEKAKAVVEDAQKTTSAARFIALSAQYEELRKKFVQPGLPKDSWSEKELSEYIKLADLISKNGADRLVQLEKSGDKVSEAEKQEKTIKESMAAAQENAKHAQEFLDKKKKTPAATKKPAVETKKKVPEVKKDKK